MSDPSYPAPVTATEDRILPAIVYALFLIGLSNGLTVLIGLIIAYASMGAAGPKARSHYVFQIRTFWTCVVWALIGAAVVGLGGVLMLILIGFPILHLGLAILGLAGVWFFIRTVAGAIYLAQDVAYPRPRSWLL